MICFCQSGLTAKTNVLVKCVKRIFDIVVKIYLLGWYLLKFPTRHMGYSVGKINHENVKPVMIPALGRNLNLYRRKEEENMYNQFILVQKTSEAQYQVVY